MKLENALDIIKKIIDENNVKKIENAFIRKMADQIALEMDAQILKDLLKL